MSGTPQVNRYREIEGKELDMLGLMIRDLMVQRKRLWVMVMYCVLFPLLFKREQAALVAVIIASVYMMLLTAFSYDDKYKADGTMISLPIKREMLVMARYLEVPVLAIAAVLIYMLATALMAPWIPGLFPTSWVLPAAGFMSASIMCGLYMPIIYRFGYVKARIFNMVIFMLFFAVIPAVGFLGGNSEWGIRLPDWLATASAGLITVLMTVLGVAVLAGSCMISIRVYRKREF